MSPLDSELGRMPLSVYGVLAASLQPKERLQTIGFLHVTSRICTRLSYRDAADTLNMVFHRRGDEGIRLRTLSDSMNRIGADISRELASVTEHTLKMYGFDQNTGLPCPDVVLSDNITGPVLPNKADDAAWCRLKEAVDEINASREEAIPSKADEIPIEPCPDECVYISIDDIGVKRQKSERKEGSVRESRYVENTVAHIQYGEHSCLLTAIGMRCLFKSVLAFLLANNLLGRELIFFTDGARDIRSHIGEVFSFHPSRTILDWYHLKKKCMELLSMAVRGKDERNAVVEKLLRYLWVGDVEGGRSYLQGLPETIIKSKKWQDELAAYLERKQENITCYALRAKLGLRNSSNPVEKGNDILIAGRQKHNGMAWTPGGSGALAAIEMVYYNQQSAAWFSKRRLSLFAPKGELCA